METTGKISQIEVTENNLFYCSQVTWCSTRTHTHTHTHTHTLPSHPLPWYFRQICVDNVYLSFFNHALPKFKVRPVSPEFRVAGDWLKRAAPQTWVTLLASRYQFCHTIPARFLLKPHTCNNRCKRRARGRNFQSEQNGRWLADANLYKKFEF